LDERLARIEERVENLRSDLQEIKEQLSDIKRGVIRNSIALAELQGRKHREEMLATIIGGLIGLIGTLIVYILVV